ncbi:MAG: acyl-CoA dehydrogenase family protein [Steroidobacteraceae bacterium]
MNDEALSSDLRTTPSRRPSVADELRHRAESAAAVAAQHADAVDREARFPEETFADLRAQRLLGMQVPVELGGEGASVTDTVDACYVLGRSCASSAMIFAMHQIMMRILVRHGIESGWHRALMRRIATEQLLLASSTTENQTGGDVRSSTCAVELSGDRFSLTKNATVMSYGAQADAVLTTARRAPESAPSDQVLVVLMREQYRLERIVDWDALGMRGTCSTGFTLRGAGSKEQVLAVHYDTIHAESMVPVAHLTWSAVWTGIAAGAVARAQRFVREAARKGAPSPPGTPHLARTAMQLRALRGSVAAALHRYESAALTSNELGALEFQTAINLLKVSSSETAIATVLGAMQACGLSGYRNQGEFSIGRSLRDVLSSAIMINNDRILASAASALLLVGIPERLRD